MFETIVVGTDGSATANAAVQRAAELAKQSGARVELVSGYRENYSSVAAGMGAGMYPGDLATDARDAAGGCLEEAAAKLRSEGLEVETHCMGGDAAEALIGLA